MKLKRYRPTLSTILKLDFLMLATLALCSPFQVSAQSSNSIEPKDPTIVSPGGVDMRSGAYLYTSTDAQIGSLDGGGIALVRSRMSADVQSSSPYLPYNVVWSGVFAMTHNWNVRIYEHRIYVSDNYLYPADYSHQFNRYLGDFRYFAYFGSSVTTLEWPYRDRGIAFIRSSAGSPPTWLNRVNGELVDTPTFSLQQADGTLINFGPMGQNCGAAPAVRCALASTMQSPDGTLYTFSYSGQNLISVVSNRALGLRFFYGADPTLGPVHACLFNLARAPMPQSYPCNGSGQLNIGYNSSSGFEVTKPDGRSERIVVGLPLNNLRPVSFYKEAGTNPWLVNYEADIDAVVRQEFASGEVYTYNYTLARYAEPVVNAGGSYSSPDGSVTRVNFAQVLMPRNRLRSPYGPTEPCTGRDCTTPPVYQVSSGPTSVVDALGRTVTANYCDPAVAALSYVDGGGCLYDNLQSITNAEGEKTKYTYSNGNNMVVERRRIAKPGTGIPDIVETAEYRCPSTICRTAMTRYVDAMGNATDFEISAVHRQILSKTGPAGASGVQPRTRYNYVQRNARDMNGVVLQPPVWLLASEKTCRTSATAGDACAAGASDEVSISYDYGPDAGPNNLWLRGKAVTADGQTLRTCYAYDTQGNEISETSPRAGLAVCP